VEFQSRRNSGVLCNGKICPLCPGLVVFQSRRNPGISPRLHRRQCCRNSLLAYAL
jgi:hypothetical protein